jgi:hypothetical protein
MGEVEYSKKLMMLIGDRIKIKMQSTSTCLSVYFYKKLYSLRLESILLYVRQT